MATPTPSPPPIRTLLPLSLSLPQQGDPTPYLLAAFLLTLLLLLAHIARTLHTLVSAHHTQSAALNSLAAALTAKHSDDPSASIDRVAAALQTLLPPLQQLLQQSQQVAPMPTPPPRVDDETNGATPRATDADLYKRKVEALEGLRRALEAQQHSAPPVNGAEGEGLYRRRVEALEGLRRVLEEEEVVPKRAKKRGKREEASEGRKGLRRERSAETLGESLADL